MGVGEKNTYNDNVIVVVGERSRGTFEKDQADDGSNAG